MHWAVRGKKEPMLEAPDLNLNHKKANECLQEVENNNGGLLEDQNGPGDFDPSDGKLLSPKSPDFPGKWYHVLQYLERTVAAINDWMWNQISKILTTTSLLGCVLAGLQLHGHQTRLLVYLIPASHKLSVTSLIWIPLSISGSKSQGNVGYYRYYGPSEAWSGGIFQGFQAPTFPRTVFVLHISHKELFCSFTLIACLSRERAWGRSQQEV